MYHCDLHIVVKCWGRSMWYQGSWPDMHIYWMTIFFCLYVALVVSEATDGKSMNVSNKFFSRNALQRTLRTQSCKKSIDNNCTPCIQNSRMWIGRISFLLSLLWVFCIPLCLICDMLNGRMKVGVCVCVWIWNHICARICQNSLHFWILSAVFA